MSAQTTAYDRGKLAMIGFAIVVALLAVVCFVCYRGDQRHTAILTGNAAMRAEIQRDGWGVTLEGRYSATLAVGHVTAVRAKQIEQGQTLEELPRTGYPLPVWLERAAREQWLAGTAIRVNVSDQRSFDDAPLMLVSHLQRCGAVIAADDNAAVFSQTVQFTEDLWPKTAIVRVGTAIGWSATIDSERRDELWEKRVIRAVLDNRVIQLENIRLQANNKN